ncbi:MAG: DegQ family serine endoprotease [Deltaproteobacteria bacterium]|nr:DegQ family serine endoprotease [Deltaproteobacteria bacterium]
MRLTCHSTAISKVAKGNIPAVVHIDVIQRKEVVNPFYPFENDPFFRYFFGGPQMPRKFKQELRGLGTGMIMDKNGYILTNNHVVAGANEIKVLLASGERYPAKLIGTDPKTDLAVIKISADKPLPHVTFGDSDKVEVGQWVVAIGHPRGLDQTVTQGIISAKHRRGIMDPSSYQDYLQTDAAINPGNSGGPLLNLQGEVIGVNAAIVTQSGGFEGIGFAIPSNMALHIAHELIAHGKVRRGWLGVSVQDLTPELAEAFHVKENKGAVVADVEKDGPAEKAGIKRGDIVISYNGRPVADASSLRNMVALTPVGKKVELDILRKGKRKTITVKVGSLEEALKMRLSSLKERLGVEVRPVTRKDMERYGLQSRQGVVIIWVDPKGPLGKAGFEVDDMILEINGEAIREVDDLANIVDSLPHGKLATILALDHRSGRTGYIRVMIG